MILAAIEALGDPNGSNKSSISKQIEATYGNLPPAYSTLLAHHLNRMKSSGQLIFLKNNYLKPDNAPPRRGRGRPPKPKAPPLPGILPSPTRPRGRPPKSRDPDAPPPPPKPKPAAAAPSTVSGKKRGRPPKATTSAVAAPPTPTAVGAPRGRGRPPKVKPAATAPVGA